MIKPNRTPVSISADEARPPRHWKNKGGDFQSLEPVEDDEKKALQELLDGTFKNVRTRDRREGVKMPSRLKVTHAHRIENSELWKKYLQGVHFTKNKRTHKCTQTSQYGGEVLTQGKTDLPGASGLHRSINECYLWHGTSPKGAEGISKEGLRLNFSGSHVGTMYGKGLYMAECSSKSDEYSHDDKDGIYKGQYCFLLCRTVLGELLHLTAGGEKVYTMIKHGIEGDLYDSVLGDREASVGTYREFVVYSEDQVYPEYLILYERCD